MATINHPPANFLPTFEEFRSLNADADFAELQQYYAEDEDEAVDLASNYSGSSDEDAKQQVHNEAREERCRYHAKPFGYDKHMDLEEGEEQEEPPKPATVADAFPSGQVPDPIGPSRFTDPELENCIDRTREVLECLSDSAQSIVSDQPLATQILLANQAKDIWGSYTLHGSEARLSEAIRGFLKAGDTIRRPGPEGRKPKLDGRIRVAPLELASRSADEQRKNKHRYERDSPQLCGRAKLRAVAESSSHEPVRQPAIHDGLQCTGKINPYLDPDSALLRPRTKPRNISAIQQSTSLLSPRQQSTLSIPTNPMQINIHTANLLASYNSLSRQIRTPVSPFSKLNLSTPSIIHSDRNTPAKQSLDQSTWHKTQPKTPKSIILDRLTNATLPSEPYDPISMVITWPSKSPTTGLPTFPTKGLLDSLNRILHLYNEEARVLLSYYVRRYEEVCHGSYTVFHDDNDTEMRTCEGMSGDIGKSRVVREKVPHALFRLGIAQRQMARVRGILETKETNELGLTPEVRRVLGEVYWRGCGTHESWASAQNPISGDEDRDMDGDGDRLDGYGNVEVDVEGGKGKLEETGKRVSIGLNPVEKTLLARGMSVSVETIDAYWESMRVRTLVWRAMIAWCEKKDREIVRRAKVERRW